MVVTAMKRPLPRLVTVIERLENRQLLSGSPPFPPAEIQNAYGVAGLTFGSVAGNGSGQTIAVVDAYNDPDIQSDLQSFDGNFGLSNPTLTVVNQTGGSSLPANAPSKNNYGLEISIDVEWAHAMAPAASILLVEANSSQTTDLFQAAATAADSAGVSVVSMSFGTTEFSGDSSDDHYFTTPSGHTGVTFVAATGDGGAGVDYPASSPNVVAVGGTVLSLDSSGNYASESAWSSSSGGISTKTAQPSYQKGVVTQSTSARTVPDVAMDAGATVQVYDSYDYPSTHWVSILGTSLATPLFGAVIAIADQGRVLAGESTLDGPSQTLPMLYSAPQSDYHDITTGSNSAYYAGTGYDLVTGRGSPIANLLVPALVGKSFSTVTQLTGATIGTAGSYGNDGNTIAKATDGNLSTFFDGPTGNGNWVGLDLGSTGGIVTEVKYASRSGWASRMNGGIFQASNNSSFSSGVVNLYTIGSSANPSSSSLATQTFSNTTAYRYYRYLSPNGSFGDVAEVEFLGTAGGLKGPTRLTGTTIGTAGSYQNDGNTIAKATDGSLSTYFDGATGNGNWVGLDLGSPQTIGQISYAPRSGWASRMVGGEIQVSTTADFSSGVTTIYTITATPVTGSLTTITLSTPVTARYVRYLSPTGSFGDIAEFQVFS
jgi:subtilase family serine protease